ncbi:unannotated protein [freshwater metagenome]|uniref:Unannotated protein n=1 Tax=freshwater metagenome TaxID=449393 RepID=A0A6J7RT64_9ZZZZ
MRGIPAPPVTGPVIVGLGALAALAELAPAKTTIPTIRADAVLNQHFFISPPIDCINLANNDD